MSSCSHYRGDLSILLNRIQKNDVKRSPTTEIDFDDLWETCENTKRF